MYIAITGNIGCGKTSLTRILSERTGAKAYFEESDNPYIGDFYEDMNRWSFNLQIYFLGQRIQRAQEILKTGSDLIQDGTRRFSMNSGMCMLRKKCGTAGSGIPEDIRKRKLPG